jgi:hypothetical protein
MVNGEMKFGHEIHSCTRSTRWSFTRFHSIDSSSTPAPGQQKPPPRGFAAAAAVAPPPAGPTGIPCTDMECTWGPSDPLRNRAHLQVAHHGDVVHGVPLQPLRGLRGLEGAAVHLAPEAVDLAPEGELGGAGSHL